MLGFTQIPKENLSFSFPMVLHSQLRIQGLGFGSQGTGSGPQGSAQALARPLIPATQGWTPIAA